MEYGMMGMEEQALGMNYCNMDRKQYPEIVWILQTMDDD